MRRASTIAYLIDPRFSGGTSASFAAELGVTSGLGRVTVHAISDGLMQGHPVAPVVETAVEEQGLAIAWDTPVVSGDLVVVHNPVFLAATRSFATRIVARDLVVVAHENFLRPGGQDGFDVAGAMGRIDRASLAQRKWIAPVSPHNRRTVEDWLAGNPECGAWRIAPEDWFSIVPGPMMPPTSQPQDRRGRLSRPGLEKFPDLETLDKLFPGHARANVILGGDLLAAHADLNRPHWTILPFRSIPVDEFFGMVDFMVYFTAPSWRESFGLAVAEAVVAGKVVIADAGMVDVFGDAVIVARPDEVGAVIGSFIQNPQRYADQVRRAQGIVSAYSADRLRARVAAFLPDDLRAAS